MLNLITQMTGKIDAVRIDHDSEKQVINTEQVFADLIPPVDVSMVPHGKPALLQPGPKPTPQDGTHPNELSLDTRSDYILPATREPQVAATPVLEDIIKLSEQTGIPPEPELDIVSTRAVIQPGNSFAPSDGSMDTPLHQTERKTNVKNFETPQSKVHGFEATELDNKTPLYKPEKAQESNGPQELAQNNVPEKVTANILRTPQPAELAGTTKAERHVEKSHHSNPKMNKNLREETAGKTTPVQSPNVVFAAKQEFAVGVTPDQNASLSLATYAPDTTNMDEIDNMLSVADKTLPPKNLTAKNTFLNTTYAPETSAKPGIPLHEPAFFEHTVPETYSVAEPAKLGPTQPLIAQTMPGAPAATAQQVAYQIAMATQTATNNEIEIRLDPEELGSVKIILSTRDNGMAITVIAERPETLDLMRRNSDQLSASFSDMGYETTSFDFKDQQNKDAPDHNGTSDDQMSHEQIQSDVTTISILSSPSDGMDIRL